MNIKKCKKVNRNKSLKSDKWFSPTSAPKDGTMILGDFGLHQAIPCVYDPREKEWVIVEVRGGVAPYEPLTYWLKTSSVSINRLKQWTRIPTIPFGGIVKNSD